MEASSDDCVRNNRVSPSHVCVVCMEDPAVQVNCCGNRTDRRSSTRTSAHMACVPCLAQWIRAQHTDCFCRAPLNYDVVGLSFNDRNALRDAEEFRDANAPVDYGALFTEEVLAAEQRQAEGEEAWMTTLIVVDDERPGIPLYDPDNEFWSENWRLMWKSEHIPVHHEVLWTPLLEGQLDYYYAIRNLHFVGMAGMVEYFVELLEIYFASTSGDVPPVPRLEQAFFAKRLLFDIVEKCKSVKQNNEILFETRASGLQGRIRIIQHLLSLDVIFHTPISQQTAVSTLATAILGSRNRVVQCIMDHCDNNADFSEMYPNQIHWTRFRDAWGNSVLHLAAQSDMIWEGAQNFNDHDWASGIREQRSFLYRIAAHDLCTPEFVARRNSAGHTAMDLCLKFATEHNADMIGAGVNYNNSEADVSKWDAKFRRVQALCLSAKVDAEYVQTAVRRMLFFTERILNNDYLAWHRAKVLSRLVPLFRTFRERLFREGRWFNADSHRFFVTVVRLQDVTTAREILMAPYEHSLAGMFGSGVNQSVTDAEHVDFTAYDSVEFFPESIENPERTSVQDMYDMLRAFGARRAGGYGLF